MASTASSILKRSIRADAARYTQPAVSPMTKAAQGSTVAQPAVIATKPVRHPFIAAVVSQVYTPVFLSSTIVEVNIPESAPAADPSVVLTAASDATSPEAADAIKMELPGLNPYHPNQRAKVPRN